MTATSRSASPKDEIDSEKGERADGGGHPDQVVELYPIEDVKISHCENRTMQSAFERITTTVAPMK